MAKNRHECNFNFQHVTYLNMSLATYPSRASPTKDRKGVSTQLGEKLGPDVTERMLSLSSDCTAPQEDPSGPLVISFLVPPRSKNHLGELDRLGSRLLLV